MELAFDPAELLTTEELAGPPEKHQRLWTTLTLCEVLLASAAVLLDLIIPTFILLAMALVSLAIRRKGFSSLGFRRTRKRGLVLNMLAFAAAWSLFQLCVTMPVANHVSGKKTDLGDYKNLQRNFAMLIGLLVLSWTLAAVGEDSPIAATSRHACASCFDRHGSGSSLQSLLPPFCLATPTASRARSV